MNGRIPSHPSNAPDYESGGRGVIVLTLAAALVALFFIFFSMLRAILSRLKAS